MQDSSYSALTTSGAPSAFTVGAALANAPSAEGSRFVVRKERGSEWARVIDTQDGSQIAKYSVLPRRRSTRDGWKDAEQHAARLNAKGQR